MSIEIMNRVWSQSQQQGTKLVLLLALADMANSNGYCWPSLETLQHRARLSHYQNVIKAIEEMEKKGEVWVERNRGRKHSNTYIVTVGMSADDLAKTLITHFDYTPADAMKKASDFIKRSPQTTFIKRSPQDANVVPELPLQDTVNVVGELQNVVPEILKRSPQTTRSVKNPKETSLENPTAQKAALPPPSSSISETANLTKQILDAYIEVRGKEGVNYPKEGTFAKKIAADGGTPELVKGCYTWMKLDKFWSEKRLGLSTIYENLPEYKNYLSRATATAVPKMPYGGPMPDYIREMMQS